MTYLKQLVYSSVVKRGVIKSNKFRIPINSLSTAMKKLLYFQIIALLIVATSAWLLFGSNELVSVLLGGGCYLVPTAIMVAILRRFDGNPDQMPTGFFIGQSAKALLAIVLMVTVFFLYPSLNFLAFLAGLLAVSKIVFFVFWKMNHYGGK